MRTFSKHMGKSISVRPQGDNRWYTSCAVETKSSGLGLV